MNENLKNLLSQSDSNTAEARLQLRHARPARLAGATGSPTRSPTPKRAETPGAA